MSRPQAHEALRWLGANGHSLAPLTHADAATLIAIDACWQSIGYVDSRDGVIAAVRALLPNMQPKCHDLARELIARALDWGDREALWPLVVDATPAVVAVPIPWRQS